MNHVCKPTLWHDGRTGVDGQKYTCPAPCGRVWEYVQDDGELGSYWVPAVGAIHYAPKKQKAQRVFAERTK